MRLEPIGGRTVLLPSRKRRSDGNIVYTCTICPDWSNGHCRAANDHVWSRHPPRDTPSSSSTPAPPARQSMLSSMWTPTASADAMRNAFDPQRYREAIVGLLTRRRVLFSAVEWDEMRELALACNPHIRDKLITSRRKAVRLHPPRKLSMLPSLPRRCQRRRPAHPFC
jgi:hypothetical protein